MRKIFLVPALVALAGCNLDRLIDAGGAVLVWHAADMIITGLIEGTSAAPPYTYPGNNVVPDQYRMLICNDGHFTYGPVDRCNPGDTLVRDDTPKPETAP